MMNDMEFRSFEHGEIKPGNIPGLTTILMSNFSKLSDEEKAKMFDNGCIHVTAFSDAKPMHQYCNVAGMPVGARDVIERLCSVGQSVQVHGLCPIC